MTGILRTMMAAAGAAGGYDYLAEAIDFDGTNDYLSKSSDLTGNADGKVFTFSCWIYTYRDASTPAGGRSVYNTRDATSGFQVFVQNTEYVNIYAKNAAGTTVLELATWISNDYDYIDRWISILISVDLTDTGKRSVYIDDVEVTGNWTTYTDDNIDFTKGSEDLMIGRAYWHAGTTNFEGRMAHVLLDYNYLDLSIEANRRNFITADLHPASESVQAALSPILYLPMTNPDTAATNAGTGGDFAVAGTIARSGRGPNQDNCVASTFDGTNDYLYKTSIGASDGKAFTFSVCFKMNVSTNQFFYFSGDGNWPDWGVHFKASGGSFMIEGFNSSGTKILVANAKDLVDDTGALTIGRNYVVSISVDLSDTGKRWVFSNGVNVTSNVAWNTYTNDTMMLSQTKNYVGAYYDSGAVVVAANTDMGEVYFDDAYTDLSASNPFWDSELNKPVTLRQVIDDTGVTPLMALPIIGDDPGTNLGSGGDLTVTSGPYTGARGASEFWARSAKFIRTDSDKLTRASALTGAADGKKFTFVMAFNRVSASVSDLPFSIDTSYVELSTTGNLLVVMRATGGGNGLYFGGTTTHSADTWNIILVSVDMSDTGKRHVYMNGATVAGSYSYYVDTALEFSDSPLAIADEGGNYYNGQLGFIYFSTDYIDFSDEANRLLFVDAFGYPTDLSTAIDAGDVANPLIYMKFEDASDFGANAGTGGDYTESGSPTTGADVTPP